MGITCGIDGAESHHDVALADDSGRIVARARINTGTTGFSELLRLTAEHAGTAENTPIAIETDNNLLVVALTEAGYTVYPINPRAVARYRERHGQSGGKSDPGDAAILANPAHRPRRAPDAADDQRTRTRGQGTDSSTPGGDLRLA